MRAILTSQGLALDIFSGYRSQSQEPEAKIARAYALSSLLVSSKVLVSDSLSL
jgi:hypothetical protein